MPISPTPSREAGAGTLETGPASSCPPIVVGVVSLHRSLRLSNEIGSLTVCRKLVGVRCSAFLFLCPLSSSLSLYVSPPRWLFDGFLGFAAHHACPRDVMLCAFDSLGLSPGVGSADSGHGPIRSRAQLRAGSPWVRGLSALSSHTPFGPLYPVFATTGVRQIVGLG
jgi:hypothetical protein